jgi:hypothetical protein
MPLRRLIAIAGHAVLRNLDDPESDRSWVLLPYQQGEARCFVEHIRAAVDLAAADPQALLIFSGGQSRAEAGPLSEAQSYVRVAEHYSWFGHSEVRSRAATEEAARDSFENLLHSICRFRQIAGAYPELVTFVSWRFKEDRFALHRQAIRWPVERFLYLGVNNPPELAQALEAEAATTVLYRADPYSSGAVLRSKRQQRNPFQVTDSYRLTSPELIPLFDHQGPEVFAGQLPWVD